MSQPPETTRLSEKLQRIGDYRVIAELARGGMGRVYLARRSGQAGFERLFAIKVMHDRLLDDPEARLMLLDEAHIASRLHHPNVVSVVDVGRYESGHYLVMDYVEGCTFKQLLDRTPGYRPPRLIIPVMLDALRGLHAAHTLRNAHDEPFHVVHRDVSPDNLLVGLDGCCRVTDFGVAKARERLTDTQVGVCKGKIAFMAPEQLADGQVDARVDVWAAGLTLYGALTGEHPFRARGDGSILHSIKHDEIVKPSLVGMRPPEELDHVVMRALERDPERRFASAEEFADALREVALSEDLLGRTADVAQWVDTACGYRLAQRRRSIAELAQYERETTMPAAHASDMVSNTTGTSVEAEATLSESLEAREAVPTVPPAGLKKPQRRTSAAVVLAAMLVGGVLGWYSEDEAQAYTQRQMAQQEAAATEHTHRPVQARTPSALPPTHVLEAEPPLTPLANDAEPRQRSPRIAHTEPREDPPFVGTARALESHGDAEAERAPSLESAQPAMLMEANPYLHGQ